MRQVKSLTAKFVQARSAEGSERSAEEDKLRSEVGHLTAQLQGSRDSLATQVCHHIQFSIIVICSIVRSAVPLTPRYEDRPQAVAMQSHLRTPSTPSPPLPPLAALDCHHPHIGPTGEFG